MSTPAINKAAHKFSHRRHLTVPNGVRGPILQVQVCHRSRAGRVVRHLPDLDEVGPAVRDDKVLLAESGGADRVGGAAAVGGGQEEELLRDGARVGVEGEGGDVAGDVCRARPGGGVQVLGRGGVLARDDDLVGPVGGRVGESCRGESVMRGSYKTLGQRENRGSLPSGSSE